MLWIVVHENYTWNVFYFTNKQRKYILQKYTRDAVIWSNHPSAKKDDIILCVWRIEPALNYAFSIEKAILQDFPLILENY